MSPDEHVGTACGFGAQMASNNKWTIAGEWSGALTDCAKVSERPILSTQLTIY
jgi:glucan 1,3-beta-glucosidase